MRAQEINFDGIVGPTHHYAGLSVGNLAATQNKRMISNPRAAALQGLAKALMLVNLGFKQGILPPQERPHLPTLRRLGFTGTDAQVLAHAHRDAPQMLAGVSSASSMWTANAATVSPSADTADERVHFTPANLISNFHRSIEAPMTGHVLQTIFADEEHFYHHPPLPAANHLGDEGAANHTRLCSAYGDEGVEIFTYGRVALDASRPAPAKFPARQSFEASSTIARIHDLDPQRTVFVQQNPAAIDAGAFHNDVVAVGNQHVLLYHERAFADSAAAIESIRRAFPNLRAIEVPEKKVPLTEAIGSYLFNSQLLTLKDGLMTLLAPVECTQYQRAQDFINELVTTRTPIQSAHFVDVRQSMSNGGGPACLRLRIVLTDPQLAAVRGNVMLSESLYLQLVRWVEKHYREELHLDELADPQLLEENYNALDELTQLLRLGSIYEFQTF